MAAESLIPSGHHRRKILAGNHVGDHRHDVGHAQARLVKDGRQVGPHHLGLSCNSFRHNSVEPNWNNPGGVQQLLRPVSQNPMGVVGGRGRNAIRPDGSEIHDGRR